jgi:molecular chaperone GrpE
MRRSSMTSGRKPDHSADEGRRPGPTTRTSAYRSASGSQDPTTDPPAEGSADERTQEEDESAAGVEADLDALLADVQRERNEYLELARRTKADFENYRKRATKDAQAAEARGKASLAGELVPVLDNLERALNAADEDSELARGVALVLADLEETLGRAGVEAYDPLGERFDPAWHEALSTRPADAEEAGVVVETLERGYRLDGQVLRPARVVVSA